jgi:hypothetical protein
VSIVFIRKYKKDTRSFNAIREAIFGNIKREPHGSSYWRELEFVEN